MFSVLILLLLSILCHAVASQENEDHCPPSWDPYGQYCYFINATDQVSFGEAVEACQYMDSNLTSIHSFDEQTYHMTLYRQTWNPVWIGLHDINNENQFKWIDGSSFDYENWSPGQPDNWNQTVGDEDCVHLYQIDYGYWYDGSCDDLLGYICKKPRVEPATEAEMCSSGATEWREWPLTWPHAAVGEVAHSQETCPSGTSRAGYPLAIRHCSSSSTLKPQWDSVEILGCWDTSEDVNIADFCPSGWNLYGNYCYVLSTTNMVSFSGAVEACQHMNSNLTSIHSLDEQIYHMMLFRQTWMPVWIGMHDTSNENRFEWIDGSPLDYESWSPGQPDNWNSTEGGEDCVHLYERDYGYWNDNECFGHLGYICKKPKAGYLQICPASVTQGSDDGLLTWPQTVIGETASSNETCPFGTDREGLPLGFRGCVESKDSANGIWQPEHIAGCQDQFEKTTVTHYSEATKSTMQTSTALMSAGLKVSIFMYFMSLYQIAVTLLLVFSTRKLRERNSYHAIWNFCGALFILYLVFAAGIDATDNSTGCLLVASLLHYFTLVPLLWLAVEIRNTYTDCRSLDSQNCRTQRSTLVKEYVVSWGIPAVVVAITIGISFNDFQHLKYCAIPTGPALFYGGVIPIAVIVLYNLITFICAFFALRHRSANTTLEIPHETKHDHNSMQRSQAALVVSIAFIIKVCLGYLYLTDPLSEAIRVIFPISVALTGLVILGMFCLYLDEVRNVVLRKMGCKKSPEVIIPVAFENMGYEENRASTSEGAPHDDNASYDDKIVRVETRDVTTTSC